MDAIQLIIDGTHIVLDPDTKIRIEYNNPIFAEEIQGSKTYFFDIPAIPENQRFFGFAEIPHVSGKYKMFDNAQLILFGYRILSGKFALRKVEENYRGAFTTNVFGNNNKNKTLKDLSWETINMGSTVTDVINYANARVTEDYPTTKVNFPAVYNPDHYGEDNPAFKHRWTPENPIINQRDWNNDTFLENYLFDPEDADGNATDPDVPDGIANRTCLVPFVYLQEIISKIFEGYKLFGDFVENSIYQQLLTYNNYSLDGIDDEYYVKASGAYWAVPDLGVIFFSSYNNGAHMRAGNSLGDGNTGIFEVKQKGYHKFKVKFSISDNNLTSGDEFHVWFANVDRYIQPSQSPFTINEEFTIYMDDSDVGNIYSLNLSKNNDTADHSFSFTSSAFNVVNYSQANLNRFALDINLANHVPSKKVNETLIHLNKLFAMPVFVDNITKSAQLFLLKDIHQTGIVDITSKVNEDYQFELNEEKNQVLKLDIGEDDYIDEFKAYDHYNDLGNYTTFETIPEADNKKNIAYVASQNAIYKTQKTNYYGNVWKHYTDIAKTIEAQSTGKKEDMELSAGPLLMRGVIVNNGDYYTDSLFPLPKIKQRGISIIYDSGKQEQDYSIRLFNWIGKKTFTANDGDTNTYVASTSSEYDRDGNQVSPFSLFLNGPNGIVEYFHRPFLDFMKQTETVTVEANPAFNVKDLLDMIEVITMPQDDIIENQKRWVMINNVKYLPRRMDVEISMNGIVTVQFELIKKAN